MHGCMPGRIAAQNTARCTVPRPLFLHSMHTWQSARTIIVRRNAGRLLFHPCRACTNGFTACASKGGISPCLVRPPARPVLALLQHARVAACPSSALLGTAVNRACNGAARARDGRLQPAPAMGAAQARERRPRPGTALLVTAAMCARDRRIPRLAACFLRACYCAEDSTKT